MEDGTVEYLESLDIYFVYNIFDFEELHVSCFEVHGLLSGGWSRGQLDDGGEGREQQQTLEHPALKQSFVGHTIKLQLSISRHLSPLYSL